MSCVPVQILFCDLFESCCSHFFITYTGIYVMFMVHLEVVVVIFYHLENEIDTGL